MKKKKILLFGSSGLLGQEILTYYMNNSAFNVIAPNSIDVSITNKKHVNDIIQKEKPNIVINAAALKDVNICEKKPFTAWEINTYGPGFIVQAMTEYTPTAIFVHFSSADIFGGEQEYHMEKDTPHPISVYGWTKVASEKIVEEIATSENLSYFIIRTAWLFGIHKQTFIDIIIESLHKKKHIKVAKDQYDIPVWTYDLVQAMHQIIKSKKSISGIYHCVPRIDKRYSRFDIAQHIATLMKLDQSYIKPTSRKKIFLANRPASSILINSQTKIFAMPDWTTSLKKYIQIKYGK